MASLYKRGKVWYIQYVEGGIQHRESLKTTSKQRAEWKQTDIERKLEEGTPVGHKADISIAEFTDLYLDHIQIERQPHTCKTLAHEWKHFTKWCKATKLSHITNHHITRYKNHMLKQNYAKSTVRSSLLCISGAFKVAINELHVLTGENPVKGVDLPVADDRAVRFLDLDQIKKLLHQAKLHSRDMHLLIALGIFTGMRKAELLACRWHWFDFDAKNEDGKRVGRVEIKCGQGFRTKTGKNRSMGMNHRLRPILERYKGVTIPNDFVVFPDNPQLEPGSTKNRRDFTTAFRTIVTRAKVKWLTPHGMRHTFASQLAMANVSLYEIGTWLGHADYKTTQMYAHLCPVSEKINAF